MTLYIVVHQVFLVKKLVMTIISFTLGTSASEKVQQEISNLDQVFYFCYPLLFRKNTEKREILALIDFRSKVNAINLTYMAKLGH